MFLRRMDDGGRRHMQMEFKCAHYLLRNCGNMLSPSGANLHNEVDALHEAPPNGKSYKIQ